MVVKGINLGVGGGGGGGGKIRWKTNSSTTAMARRATSAASVVMENDSRSGYIDYKHNDSFSGSRWTTRETFLFMYGRPWKEVSDFYLDLVSQGCGYPSLSAALFPDQKHQSPNVNENIRDCEESKFMVLPTEGRVGRWERTTFKIVLSYHGGSFEGWQNQPGLNTVQGLVEKALGKFIDERKAQQLSANSLPLEGCATVAGRTDKGVTALQQVCSFYTWRKDVKSVDIKDAINNTATGILKALFVSEVSRAFHPNFAAKWRRYFYIFPLNGGDPDQIDSGQRDCTNTAAADSKQMKRQCELDEDESWSACSNGNVDLDTGMKPGSFSISKVNRILCQLEGKSLSYRMFARDTKASRSTGPPTECFMFHARAVETSLPSTNQVLSLKVMCVELVANRFLRKMVRVLVATAIREAAAGADDDALLNLMDATCRRATAPPAPPDGLCLLDVGYGEFNRENCLIL